MWDRGAKFRDQGAAEVVVVHLALVGGMVHKPPMRVGHFTLYPRRDVGLPCQSSGDLSRRDPRLTVDKCPDTADRLKQPDEVEVRHVCHHYLEVER
jgi:hypothetical protein